MTGLLTRGDDVLCRADLLELGIRPKQITQLVRRGELTRLRRDRYLMTDAPGVDRAVRIGGRLACVSLLAMWGVFVFDGGKLHVHLERSMSRLRSPEAGGRSLDRRERAHLALHWWPLRDDCTRGTVSLSDALAQAIRCQEARAAVATVDSILHLGLLSVLQVHEVFASLPERYRAILRLVDGSAESGSETFMRLILRQLGVPFRTQVQVDGVGRVDFLVAGWLIIECDSKAHHEGWQMRRRDARRDLAAAQLGLVTFRPLAEDIFYRRVAVMAAVRGLLRAHPAC